MRSGNATQPVLASTLERLNEATGGYLKARFGMPDELGWVPARQVLEHPDDYFPPLLDAMAESIGARRRKVVASFFLKDWLRQVVLASVGCYLLQQRVPDVSVENLALRFTDAGRVGEIAFLEDRVVALESDPDADDPSVRTVPTVDELRVALRDILAHQHVAPLIERLRPLVPVGDRFMWATTADTCVGFMLLLGKWTGDPGRYKDEADRLAAMEPLKGKTGTFEVEHEGRIEPALQRGCCCFAYHLDQYDRCKTCPLNSEEVQIENVRAQMAAGK